MGKTKKIKKMAFRPRFTGVLRYMLKLIGNEAQELGFKLPYAAEFHNYISIYL